MIPSIDPREKPKFLVGDRVCWTSSAGGLTKSKSGTVVALVPPGTRAMDAPEIKAFKPAVNAFGHGTRWPDESYVITIGKKLYWPRTEDLRHALTRPQEEFLLTYADEFDEALLPRKITMSPEQQKKAGKIFISKAVRLEFDGEATPAQIRIAQHFERIGLMTNVTPHGESGARNLSVELTAYGALVLFEIALQDAHFLVYSTSALHKNR